jgi:hypothetical protein
MFEQRSDVEQVRVGQHRTRFQKPLSLSRRVRPRRRVGGSHSVHDGRMAGEILIFAKLWPRRAAGGWGNRAEGDDTLDLPAIRRRSTIFAERLALITTTAQVRRPMGSGAQQQLPRRGNGDYEVGRDACKGGGVVALRSRWSG